MMDPEKIVGRLAMQVAALSDQVAALIEVLRQLKTGKVSIDDVEISDDGKIIRWKPPTE